MDILCQWDLALDADMILREQGADPQVLRARRPRAAAVADRALAEGLPLLKPMVAFTVQPVSGVRHERLLLDSGGRLSSALVLQHLAAAERVVVAICTIGPALEERAATVMSDDLALALALDSLGTLAASSLTAAFCNWLTEQAHAVGLQLSMAISPGLAGWPINVGQPELFALLKADAIGVSLTPACQMLPRKSTSQVIGLGANLVCTGVPCDYCDLRERCKHRHSHELLST